MILRQGDFYYKYYKNNRALRLPMNRGARLTLACKKKNPVPRHANSNETRVNSASFLTGNQSDFMGR